jgi:BlaI family transcriptional regulator, penicillinase repressor
VPPKKSDVLTEAELRLMDVLWQRERATVQEVLDALPKSLSLAYNSVLTTIRILEKKGYVRHVKEGRAFVYMPVVERQEATRSEIRRLVARFFDDSRDLLVLNLLEERNIDADELQRLRALLEQSKEPS